MKIISKTWWKMNGNGAGCWTKTKISLFLPNALNQVNESLNMLCSVHSNFIMHNSPQHWNLFGNSYPFCFPSKYMMFSFTSSMCGPSLLFRVWLNELYIIILQLEFWVKNSWQCQWITLLLSISDILKVKIVELTKMISDAGKLWDWCFSHWVTMIY